MSREALVVIDIQNDITKHYRDIIGNINSAVDWAMKKGIAVILYQAQQFVRRNPYLQTGYKRSRACAGAQDCLGSYLCQNKGQCFDQRSVFGIHPVKGYQGVLHYRCRCHRLCEIHLLQHGQSRICRSCYLRLCDQL